MTIKNYINTKLLNQFFPINDRVYENMLNDFCKHYEISSEFKSQKVFYSGDGYTVIPENERNFFKFIYAFKEIHNIDKSLFYLIPDVLVTHPLGVSIINNKRIIMNSVKNNSIYLNKSGFIKSYIEYKFMKDIESIDCAILAVDILGINYFHFINDVLTNFPVFDIYINKFGIRPKVIIQQNAPKFQTEWLELLGVKSDDLIEIHRSIKVKKLLVPTQHNTSIPNSYSSNKFYLLDKKSFDWIRNKVNISIPKNIVRDKIYISRPNNSQRSIANEKILFRMLKKYGFKKFLLETMTVRDQIIKFSNSSFVIGAHGAAFTNLILSSSCVVIELYPKGRYSESTMTYYQISQMYGLKHYLINSECVSPNENIIADVSLIEKIVKNSLI
tara:strand:+ start:3803 stop:4960 length:1158 start_codon:yes stop_codon:yes gene_type:complete